MKGRSWGGGKKRRGKRGREGAGGGEEFLSPGVLSP